MTIRYNAPPGSPSSLGVQLTNFYYQKKALIEVVKEQYFSQLADVTSMPKNMGKQIKRYLYLPLLSDENLNDQGIDAAGVTILGTQYYVSFPSVVSVANASKTTCVTAINDNINNNGVAETVATAGADNSGGTGFALITLTKNVIKYLNVGKTTAITAFNIGATVQQGSGNLFGSSKDIGLIDGKMPVLSESGGRVNKVGFKRKELTGSLEKFGFFDEYTQESMDFDSDEMLEEHINREMLRGANELTEDALQVDLLNSAGIVKYCGTATSNITSGETSLVTYTDLMRLGIDLDNNRTPKKTTVITGTRLVDTKTIPAARVAFIGSELKPTLKAMKDLHNNPAFIEVQKYAAGGTVLNGEIGAIDEFRFVVVPEMMKWAGAGADASASVTSYETNQRYDVFPILVVGDESFTTIGFQTDGKTVKFKITHKKPGVETADRTDPYGETGFMSIKWYYGFMVLRPERIAVIRTVARL
jgi:N4-gp56 family major capsid protein